MKDSQVKPNQNAVIVTMIGIAIILLLTLTKIVPSSKIAGYSVFVGIVFFFITEGVSKTRGNDSGLRFTTIASDIKKRGVIFWMLVPIVGAIATPFIGNLLFKGEFVSHVLGRTSSILSFDKKILLVFQVIIAAFGEEIAFRGFLFGKAAKIMPVWLCAVVSSAAFAAGHIAAGNVGIVIYDVAGIFIDSLIFTAIYQKTNNCVISTISHILGNAVGILVAFAFFDAASSFKLHTDRQHRTKIVRCCLSYEYILLKAKRKV